MIVCIVMNYSNQGNGEEREAWEGRGGGLVPIKNSCLCVYIDPRSFYCIYIHVQGKLVCHFDNGSSGKDFWK